MIKISIMFAIVFLDVTRLENVIDFIIFPQTMVA